MVDPLNPGSFSSMDSLTGFHKIVYGDKLMDLVPEGVKLGKMIAFSKSDKRLGLEYKTPVNLRLEHGVSYLGPNGVNTSLQEAIAGATAEATVKGCEMVLRGRIGLATIARSVNDKASYGRATKHVIKNLLISSYKKHEQMLFYGQASLAVVESVVGQVVKITAASFAPGIWAGAEGMKIDFFDALSSGTQQGAVTTGYSISSVNIRTRELTVVGSLVGVAAGDFIFEYGAYGNEFMGLEAMLKATSGNVFGISTASYSLWRGNVYDLDIDGGESGEAPLSFKHISNAIADAVAKGLEGKLDCFVNPRTWSDLLNEQTALRSFDSNYSVKKYDNGSQAIQFYSQNGLIEVHSSTYVKNGIAFLLDLESLSRVGSQDISFELPGTKDEFMIKLQDHNAIEYRTYCDIALFCDAIGHNIVITSIKNAEVV
jgi:hypothetical protein